MAAPQRLQNARAALALVAACLASPAFAQAPADPREANPERPTVATHAFPIAPAIVELETGVQWQRPSPGVGTLSGPVLLKIGLGHDVQLDVSPSWTWTGPDGARHRGFADAVVGIKWKVAELPILSTFAIQPSLKLATGDAADGTGTTDLTLLLISSRSVGPVSIDINGAYTWRSGNGTTAPTRAALWTVSSGFPVVRGLGWAAEIFGNPATSGPAGSRKVVAFLTGPTWRVQRSVVVDAGFVFDITGFGGRAVYAGVTWNLGRLR